MTQYAIMLFYYRQQLLKNGNHNIHDRLGKRT